MHIKNIFFEIQLSQTFCTYKIAKLLEKILFIK